MTAEEFVKACHYEKIDALKDYFEADSESAVGKIIQKLIQSGVRRDDLYRLVDTVLNDTYYTILLGLDGAGSLGNTQVTYSIRDEEGNLLNECGEIEASAYEYFMEE